jgi:hypothetical protein
MVDETMIGTSKLTNMNMVTQYIQKNRKITSENEVLNSKIKELESIIDSDNSKIKDLTSKLKEKTSQITVLTFQVGDLITDIENQNLKIAEQADRIIKLEEERTQLKEENKILQQKFERNYETIIAYEEKLIDFKNRYGELNEKYQQQNQTIHSYMNYMEDDNDKVFADSSTQIDSMYDSITTGISTSSVETQTNLKRKRDMETQSDSSRPFFSESSISSMNSLVNFIGNSETQKSISSICSLLESIQKVDSSKINEVSASLSSSSRPPKKKRVLRSNLNTERDSLIPVPIPYTSSSSSSPSTSSSSSNKLINIVKKYDDGSIYEGGWKNDKKHGKGKFISASGKIFEGNWKNHKRDGQFITTSSSGKKHHQIYENGKLTFSEIYHEKRKSNPSNPYGEYASSSEIEKSLSTDNKKKRKLDPVDDKVSSSDTPKKKNYYKGKSIILIKDKNNNLTFKRFESQTEAGKWLNYGANLISMYKNSSNTYKGWKIYNDNKMPTKYKKAYKKFIKLNDSNESGSSSISSDSEEAPTPTIKEPYQLPSQFSVDCDTCDDFEIYSSKDGHFDSVTIN